MEMIRSNKIIENIYKKNKYDYLYRLVNEEKTIGIATINKDLDNFIWIYIQEKYRGNGYGKKIFNEIINIVKELGYKEFKVYVDNKNIQMVKILNDFKAFPISCDNGISHYVILLEEM